MESMPIVRQDSLGPQSQIFLIRKSCLMFHTLFSDIDTGDRSEGTGCFTSLILHTRHSANLTGHSYLSKTLENETILMEHVGIEQCTGTFDTDILHSV